MDDTRFLERAAETINALYSMAESQQAYGPFDPRKRPIAEGVDKRSVRSLIRSLEIVGYPEVAQSVSELAKCAFWTFGVEPQEAAEAKANAVGVLDRVRKTVKHDASGGLAPEPPERADFVAALIDAAILADEIAILGSAYQVSVEDLMFRDSYQSLMFRDYTEKEDGGEDRDGEDPAAGLDASASTSGGDSADEASTYELELAAMDVGPAVQRLRSHGAAAAAAALEELHAAVSRIISAIDNRKPLRGYAADRVEKVFDSDIYTLHRTVLVEVSNNRVSPEVLDERDAAAEVDPPLDRLPGSARVLARDDGGYLLVGPSFPTAANADDFVEKLASELRVLADDDLAEIAPRTFRSPHQPGEDYPGQDERSALYFVRSVTLCVGTMEDVIVAWQNKKLFSREGSLTAMFNEVYGIAGFGGFF